jgi:RND family efflux transporter MFP subunit
MAKSLEQIAVLAVMVLLAACDSPLANQPREVETSRQKQVIAVPVEVVEARLGEIYRPIFATGSAQASQEAHVAAKISGRIQSIAVEEGEKVAKGALLFTLDKTDLLLAREAALAQLAVGKASLAEADIAYNRLSRDRERFQRLFENQATSQQKFEEVQSAWLTAKAKVDLAQANLRALSANLSLADSRLKDAEVRAPLGGFVIRRAANPGEFIAPGTPIISLSNHDPLKLETEVSEIESPRVRPGIPVEVTFDALPGKAVASHVTRIIPRVNPQSRTLRVEIAIPNQNHLIKPGMFGRVTIKTKRATGVPILPLRAVLTDPAGRPFIIVSKENRAVLRKITTGLGNDKLVEVRQGVTLGDLVLVTGNFGLEEGTLLAPRQVSY